MWNAKNPNVILEDGGVPNYRDRRLNNPIAADRQPV
jgi:hypothetical protein